jgi:hypothetical protein
VRDAFELERRGIATLVLCSEPFRLEAQTTARLLGIEGIRLGILTHPISSLTDEELRARAREAVAAVDTALLAARPPAGAVTRH